MIESNQNKKENPNLQPKVLVEPMIFEGQDGKPLIPAMDFFADPLDPNIPLPPIQPLGIEYEINWNEVDKKVGKPVLSLDYLSEISKQNASSLADKEETSTFETSSSGKLLQVSPKLIKESSVPVTDFAKAMNEEESKHKPFKVARYFISAVFIRIIDDKYYLYSGQSYVQKTNLEVAREVIRVCRNKFQLPTSSFVDGIVNLLLREPDIYVPKEKIPDHLISFQNCVLDINNRKIMNHSPDFLTLYEINGKYLTSYISTPVFDNFLNTVTGSDMLLIERIWQFIGYIITPDTKAKTFFLLQGIGNSGKTVLTNLILELFSDNAVFSLDINSFGDKFALSNLVGKAVCSSPDLPDKPLTEQVVGKFKQLTGDDQISSDVKNKDHVKFKCTAKLIVVTNHALLTKTTDEAFYYRVCTIPFKYSIPKEKQDFNLKKKLMAERDGIITKAINAYFRLVDNGYVFAGNYQPNKIIEYAESPDMDFRIKIFEFARNNFVNNNAGIVFIEDAFNCFCNRYGGITVNEFSSNFQQYVSEIYGAKKSRKRRPGATNPISCITGISFKEEDNNDLQDI